MTKPGIQLFWLSHTYPPPMAPHCDTKGDAVMKRFGCDLLALEEYPFVTLKLIISPPAFTSTPPEPTSALYCCSEPVFSTHRTRSSRYFTQQRCNEKWHPEFSLLSVQVWARHADRIVCMPSSVTHQERLQQIRIKATGACHDSCMMILADLADPLTFHENDFLKGLQMLLLDVGPVFNSLCLPTLQSPPPPEASTSSSAHVACTHGLYRNFG